MTRDNKGRFVARNRADTILPTTTLSSISSSPQSESSITDSTAYSISPNYSPGFPPAPPPSPIQKPQPLDSPNTMQLTNLDEFDGEPDGKIQGPTFLLRFLRVMHETQVTTDGDKIQRFGLYLTPDSPAEEWYVDTGSLIKIWVNFETEFKNRFPGVQKAKKTAAELEREMLGLVLKTDDLDKTESYGGVEVETYKVHAKKLFEIAKRAKIDSGTANIVHVRDKLPEILKDKVGESHANWKAFCTAIETIDRTYIRDEVRKHREHTAQIDSLSTQITRVECTLARSNNPISDLTTQLSRTTISNTHVAPPIPLPCQFTQQSNPIRQTGPRLSSVTTEDEKTIVRANITKYPQHPNTAEGRRSYFEQLRTWKTVHGENAQITVHTPFPLRPGTASVCSGECYTCGMQGHRGADCVVEGTVRVPPQESRWRALCGKCLGRSRRDQATAVNHVAKAGEFTWAGYADEQGNGEGPPV